MDLEILDWFLVLVGFPSVVPPMISSGDGASGPGAGVDNYLLESGDNYILETGTTDVYLLE